MKYSPEKRIDVDGVYEWALSLKYKQWIYNDIWESCTVFSMTHNARQTFRGVENWNFIDFWSSCEVSFEEDAKQEKSTHLPANMDTAKIRGKQYAHSSPSGLQKALAA